MHCASWVPLSFLQHCLHTCILSTNLLVSSSVRADGMIFKLRTSRVCYARFDWSLSCPINIIFFFRSSHTFLEARAVHLGCLCVVEQTKLLLRARAVCSFLERLPAADFSPVFFVVVASTAPPTRAQITLVPPFWRAFATVVCFDCRSRAQHYFRGRRFATGLIPCSHS